MAENSGIRWTHNTFNPWMGCVKVSDGCKHCYAETLITRRMGRDDLWGPAKTTHRQRTSPANWNKPKQWNREAQKEAITQRTFSGSLCDVFEDHPDTNAARPEFWELVRTTPFLQWQLLTKRPENVLQMLPADWSNGWPHVWIGTSVEDLRVRDRLSELAKIPAVVRFVSYEPALGPLDDLTEAEVLAADWWIYGGESGPGFRAHDLHWPRAMRDRLADLGVAFFYKQASAPQTEMYIELDGERVEQYPVPRCVTNPSEYRMPSKFGDVIYHDVLIAQRARIARDTGAPAPRVQKHIEREQVTDVKNRELPLFGDRNG